MKGAEKRKLLRKRTDVGAVILHHTFVLSHITTSHSVEQTVMLLCRYSLAVRKIFFFFYFLLCSCMSFFASWTPDDFVGLLIFTGCHFTACNSHMYWRVVNFVFNTVVIQLLKKVLVVTEPESFLTDNIKIALDYFSCPTSYMTFGYLFYTAFVSHL